MEVFGPWTKWRPLERGLNERGVVIFVTAGDTFNFPVSQIIIDVVSRQMFFSLSHTKMSKSRAVILIRNYII